MTSILRSQAHAKFRTFLAERGYSFEDRPHQVFLARLNHTVVNLYNNGKVVLGGSDLKERAVLLTYIQSQGGEVDEDDLRRSSEISTQDLHQTRVGMDEAGKGDFFGPLVTCAVLATEQLAVRMRDRGIRDSKDLSAESIRSSAEWLRREALQPGQFRVVTIPPTRYNMLMLRMGSLNRLLGWGHARALEDVLRFPEPCHLAIADQFGDPKFIEDALMTNGRQVQLLQIPKGERDVVVAAASVLARDEFVTSVDRMGQRYGEHFPLGASDVEKFSREFVTKHGADALLDTAKVHFSTTVRVVQSIDSLVRSLNAREAEDRARPRVR